MGFLGAILGGLGGAAKAIGGEAKTFGKGELAKVKDEFDPNKPKQQNDHPLIQGPDMTPMMSGGPAPVPSPLGNALSPSYETGTAYVPETGKTEVHKGEAIIPADKNPWNPDIVLGAKQIPNPKGLKPISDEDIPLVPSTNKRLQNIPNYVAPQRRIYPAGPEMPVPEELKSPMNKIPKEVEKAGQLISWPSKLYEQGKALLAPIPKEDLDAKQQMIDEYRQATTSIPKEESTSGLPVIGGEPKDPTAAYGTRPGEQRLDPLLRPLGPKLPEPKELQSAYDDGTKNIPEDGDATVHKGEAIIPADLNPWNDDRIDNYLPLVGYGPSEPSVQPGMMGRHRGDTVVSPSAPQAATLETPAPPAPSPEQVANQQKKAEAAKTGNLLELGAATIEENHMFPKYTGLGAEKVGEGEKIPEKKEASDERIYQYHDHLANAQKMLDDAMKTGDPLRIDEARLYKRQVEDEKPHEGFLSKLGHVAGEIGGTALGQVFPKAAAVVPGTPLYNIAEKERLQESIAKETQQKEQAATTAKTQAEIRALGIPKLMPDSEGGYDRATGQIYEKWQMPYGGGTVYAPQGSTAADVMAIKTGQKPAPDTSNFVLGKPTPETAPASQAELQNAQTEISRLPGLTPEDQSTLVGELPAHPTVNDVKMAKETAKTVAAARQKKDENAANLALRQLTASIAEDREQDRQQKLAADSVKKADNAYTTLAASQEYKKSMHDWFDSKNYSKVDQALIGDLLGDMNKSAANVLGGLANDTLIGAAVGKGPGAVAGAVAGALQSALGGTFSAAIEAAKRRGLSDEAYKAMQAYSTVIPGMIGYEVSVKGTPATVLRSAKTVNAIMNVLPSPATPPNQFDTAFNLYYKPMEKITNDMVKELPRMPADYKKPDINMYEDSKAKEASKVGGGETPLKNPVWDAKQGKYVSGSS